MTFSTHKQKIPSEKSFFGDILPEICLCTFRWEQNFVAKVIDNAHMEAKNSLVWKQRMPRVPGRRMQIMGNIIPCFY